MSLSDLENLRLSGLGSRDRALHVWLSRYTRERITALWTVWKHLGEETVLKFREHHWKRLVAEIMDRPGFSCSDYDFPPHPTFLCRATCIDLVTLDNVLLRSIAREMPKVVELFVDGQREAVWRRRFTAVDSSTAGLLGKPLSRRRRRRRRRHYPTVENIPDEISLLSGLQCLSLRACALRSLPSSILGLHQLERLDLNGNLNLRKLPEDIGLRLPRLMFVDVGLCALETLPLSLLQRLETNFVEEEREEMIGVVRGRMLRCGLVIGVALADFIGRMVTPNRFPRLASGVLQHNHVFPIPMQAA